MLGMSVHQVERNRGIGSALMAYAIDWARASGVLTRIELYVYASNARAIHLYEKFGFQLEGRRRQAIYQNGQYREFDYWGYCCERTERSSNRVNDLALGS